MLGYHVTTNRKLERYKCSNCILPPVRFWPNIETARRWAIRTGRNVILKIEATETYPLPDHIPARWTPEIIRKYEEIK